MIVKEYMSRIVNVRHGNPLPELRYNVLKEFFDNTNST